MDNDQNVDNDPNAPLKHIGTFGNAIICEATQTTLHVNDFVQCKF